MMTTTVPTTTTTTTAPTTAPSMSDEGVLEIEVTQDELTIEIK